MVSLYYLQAVSIGESFMGDNARLVGISAVARVSTGSGA